MLVIIYNMPCSYTLENNIFQRFIDMLFKFDNGWKLYQLFF